MSVDPAMQAGLRSSSSELQKFLFEGLPVRGILVRLTHDWRELLSRRHEGGPHVPEVAQLLGEMSAAVTLMQSNLKFNGSLLLQVQGDGPVRLAVAEAQSDLSFRATATVKGKVEPGSPLSAMLNPGGGGRCALTLDPKDRQPGQQPYQGVVPLVDAHGTPFPSTASMLEHYMAQSEQLQTRIILAADAHVAAGLLVQYLPGEGEGNLQGTAGSRPQGGEAQGAQGLEAFERIAHLAGTLSAEELLGLDTSTLLRRLFWEETLRIFEPQAPRFACTCSAERVKGMLISLGREEVQDIVTERGSVEVGCEFCGRQYRFDAVDAAGLFADAVQSPGGSGIRH